MATIGNLMAYLGVDTSGLKKAEKEVGGSTKKMEMAFTNLGGTILKVFGVREVIRGFTMEVTAGLKAVEDYNISVASMAAFISTFSKKTAEGDFAGSFKEAKEYAEALIPRLEILDAKTVSTGRDLTIMAETMAMNGVVLDINNKRQEQGFLNIANALKLVTQGQNSEIQMRQEINALLMGQMRMTDRLPKVLKAVDPNIQAHIKLWKEEGTVIENVGNLLKGFGEATDLITQTWAAVGTTLRTIHNRILRGGMKDMYDDILSTVRSLNNALMDQDGNLSSMSKTIVGGIAAGWEVAKSAIKDVFHILKALLPLGKALGLAFDGIGMMIVMWEPVLTRVFKFLEGAILQIQAGFKLVSGDLAGAKEDWEKSGKLGGEAFAGGLFAEIEAAYDRYQLAKKTGEKLTVTEVDVPELQHRKSVEALQKSIDADKTALDKRIKQYEKFYADLDKAMEAHYKKEYDLIKRNAELIAQEVETRQSTERLLYSLRAGMGVDTQQRTDEEDFDLARSDLANQLAAANRLVGDDKIKALEAYKQKVYDIAVLFNEGFEMKGNGFMWGWDIYEQAISDIEAAYATQKQTQEEMAEANRQAEEANRLWGEQLVQTAEDASTELNRLRDVAFALEEQIAKMDSYIKLNVEDQATSIIDGIQMEIDRLRDMAREPIIITTIHREVFDDTGRIAPPPDAFGGGPIGSHASGIDYIPRTGLYKLHQGEAVIPQSENNPQGRGNNFGDININVSGNAGNVDWRRVVREQIKPELDRLRN